MNNESCVYALQSECVQLRYRVLVEMKGKVACEMGSNELIITELIFQGTLSKYEPAEIAALLSSLVFQVKLENVEQELTEKLKEVCYFP